MNNLDHIKNLNFYPENYKLDLSETMKAALSKGPTSGTSVSGMSGGAIGAVAANAAALGMSNSHNDMTTGNAGGLPGVGYVTEKLYMLLQLYLQNKGWNPSAELLQCFTDLKDNAMLPSAAYLQVLANRLTLDAQGRLILRENGKIVLPFEHFANAVMLKHMSGPHGLHLSVEATVRAVIESYTIGRENFGMEKEFIVEVVQSCPSSACRYYKNHLGMSPLPFMEQQFPGVSPADFLQHMPHMPPPHGLPAGSTGPSAAGSVSTGQNSAAGNVNAVTAGNLLGLSGEVDLTKSSASGGVGGVGSSKLPAQLQHLTKQQQNSIQTQLSQISAAAAAAHHQQQLQQQAAVAAAAAAQQQAAAVAAAKQAQQQQQQQQAQAQQQQQQQQQQQLTAALIQQQQNRVLAQQSLEKFSSLSALEKQRVLQQLDPKHFDPMAVAAAAANLQMQGLMGLQNTNNNNINNNNSSSNAPSAASVAAVNATMSHHMGVGGVGVGGISAHQLPPPAQSPNMPMVHPPPSSSALSSTSSSSASSTFSTAHTAELVQKSAEVLRTNLESLESNKDLLALHNGAWSTLDNTRDVLPMGQDKIVRVFAELMRNMARMKTYIRPSMCKPYGKQSESLQKTLLDTIQIVQTLRNCLPAPHIPVTSWKSESEGSGSNMGAVAGVVNMQGNSSSSGGGLVGNHVINMSGANGLGISLGVGVGSNLTTNRVENLSN